MHYTSAVAFYGAKTGPFKDLLVAVRDILHRTIGKEFIPYTLEQIHGTLIRLDGVPEEHDKAFVNDRYYEITGFAHPMNPDLALAILQDSLTPPCPIRFGGYRPGSPAKFSSRSQHPHDRMFSVQGRAFVLMGWPAATVANGLAAKPLDDLRRSMNAANIFHWYHQSRTDIDNDLHIVVGHHEGAPDYKIQAAVTEVREYLTEYPIEISLGIDQVVVIVSDSTTLASARFIGRIPKDSAEIITLFDPGAAYGPKFRAAK
jgi:hypothetical protein